MALPQARLITVKSAVLSSEDLEEEERILEQVESRQHSEKPRRPSFTECRIFTNSVDSSFEVCPDYYPQSCPDYPQVCPDRPHVCPDRPLVPSHVCSDHPQVCPDRPQLCHEDSATESIQGTSLKAPDGKTASIFIAPAETNTQNHRVRLGDLNKTGHLALHSISTTLAEDEGRGSTLFGEGISQILEWFRTLLTQVSKKGKVTVRDMKQAAKDNEVCYIQLFVSLAIVMY